MPNLWNSVAERLGEWIDVPFRTEVDGDVRPWGEGTPHFTLKFSGALSLTALMRSTSLALGEAYQDGRITIDGDLYEVLDQLMAHFDSFYVDRAALRSIVHSALSKVRQKTDVSSHYDLGNDFYRLWLDPNLTYSCAYFPREDMTLAEAQDAKIDHTLAKLDLRPGSRLLDIGCGWGALLIRAARKYGVSAVGVTLSAEQKTGADEAIAREGLEGQVSVELLDYRDLADRGETFDRLVSVGMVEHVGRGNYRTYFRDTHKLLAPGGLFLLHGITALTESSGDPWIKKHIFPGGEIPSLRELISHGSDEGFYTIDVESLRRHYQKTLLCWLSNFNAVRPKVAAERGERFARTWELYLAACAASFHRGNVDIHQILFSNGVANDLPMVRQV